MKTQPAIRQFKDAGLGDTDDHRIPSSSESDVIAALRDINQEARALRESVTR